MIINITYIMTHPYHISHDPSISLVSIGMVSGVTIYHFLYHMKHISILFVCPMNCVYDIFIKGGPTAINLQSCFWFGFKIVVLPKAFVWYFYAFGLDRCLYKLRARHIAKWMAGLLNCWSPHIHKALNNRPFPSAAFITSSHYITGRCLDRRGLLPQPQPTYYRVNTKIEFT